MFTPPEQMYSAYESDRYNVVCFPYEYEGAKTYGWEIFDKAVEAELFLCHATRDPMDQAVLKWKANKPSVHEVESFLAALTSLALLPLVSH